MGGISEIPFSGNKRKYSDLTSVPVLELMPHRIKCPVVFSLKNGTHLDPRSRDLLEKLPVALLFKEVPAST